ncbi:MAG: peptidylprolyl isomerase [Bacteroidota bacterium]
MNRLITTTVVLFFLGLSAFAQKKKDILMTIDDRPVLISEFKRVYKKNLDLVQDESQKSVDGYMDLFIDYKLKVAEAYAQKFHEAEQYKKDFSKYEEQLSRNYIFENKVTSELAKEAYTRGLEEIDASHILILVGYDAVPQDTLAAYNKISAIRDRAVSGEDFAALAKDTSEEPNIEKTQGRLGYFTVFSLVYPFESGAYATQVGEVSEIVRTQYGYHIIKVHDRRSKAPEITVSHIMVSAKDTDGNFNPSERINEIKSLLDQGEPFEQLAKQYSDDKNSGKNGGKLKRFSKGDLRSEKFEKAAYELENPGDVSEPVLSEFGWHIIRLEEKHPLPTFEERREALERRVKEGSRSKIVSSAVNKKIKEKHGFQKGEDYWPYFGKAIADSAIVRKWKYDTVRGNDNKRIFTVGDREIFFNDFAQFIYVRQFTSVTYTSKVNMLADYYDEFETQELKRYFRERLEMENDEYAAIISEYRDGLLIFDVMGKNVWRKAKKDSVGQQEFFVSNRSNYQWKERISGQIFSATKKDVVDAVANYLELGKTGEEIKELLNKDDKVNVLLTAGTFEVDRRELPSNFEVKKGVSKVYNENNTFIVVKVEEVIPPGLKELEDVKGKVISDYQSYVEEQWMQSLRSKYKVEINEKALKKLKKQMRS